MKNTSQEHYNGVLKQKHMHEQKLLKKKNVNGVGIGYKEVGGKITDELCVKVFVTKKDPKIKIKPDDFVPQTLGVGKQVKTDVVEIGEIVAQPVDPTPPKSLISKIKSIFSIDRKAKFRPVIPGVSVGNIKITAGTVGCVCLWAGKKVLLSNAHVFCEDPFKGISESANTDYGVVCSLADDDPTPQQETAIIQQGSYDGGTLAANNIGKLRKMVLLTASGPNWTDCAMCELNDGIEVDATIPDVGIPTGIVAWSPTDSSLLNMGVMKSGRTTGTTHGTVQAINTTVSVSYGTNSATFKEQYVFSGMSAGGDSGSLIVRESDKKAVALLFAGSTSNTIGVPIEHAIKPLGIELLTTQEPTNTLVINFSMVKDGVPTGNWTVKGVVTDSVTSQPLSATLVLDTISTSTDSTGNFIFNDVAVGQHTLSCSAEGYKPQVREFEIV